MEVLMAQNDTAEDNSHSQELVTITVDTKPYKIHRGRQTVADIKKLAAVPLAFELEQLGAGKLTPVPDDGSETVKSAEDFLSHPQDVGRSQTVPRPPHTPTR